MTEGSEVLHPDEHLVVLFHADSGGGAATKGATALKRYLGRRVELFALQERHGMERAMSRVQQLVEEVGLEAETADLDLTDSRRIRAAAAEATPRSTEQPLGRSGGSVRVVVLGGDGSVNWTVRRLVALGLPHVPVVPLPCGTGNDLSNSLGWGQRHSAVPLSASAVRSWLRSVRSSHALPIDLWEMECVVRSDRGDGVPGRIVRVGNRGDEEVGPPSLRRMWMNSVSLGCDAELQATVERRRTSFLAINELAFLFFGVCKSVAAWFQSSVTQSFASVTVDSHRLDPFALGPYESFILLNIASYGGGFALWDMARPLPANDQQRLCGPSPSAPVAGTSHPALNPPRSNTPTDSTLEVVGVRTLAQLGSSIVCNSRVPRGIEKVCQARRVDVELLSEYHGPLPLQVDGEAFVVWEPERIAVRRVGFATLLRKRPRVRDASSSTSYYY